MNRRIKKAFGRGVMPTRIVDDYSDTFKGIGLGIEAAVDLSRRITSLLASLTDLGGAEEAIQNTFRRTKVNGRSIRNMIDEKLHEQAEVLFGHVSPYLQAAKDKKVIDLDCHDSQVIKLLQERLNLTIVYGWFDADDGECECAAGVMINTHYSEDLRLATEAIASGGILVAVEPVLIHDTEPGWDSMLLNDHLFSRLLLENDADLPETCQTASGWEQMFAEFGWELVKKESLGNLKLFREWHIMYVLRKP